MEEGFVETLFGRKRYLPEIHSGAYASKKAALREAINHPIQGTAADLIKMAMINLSKEFPWLSSAPNLDEDLKLILQIHDELVFEVKENKKDFYKNKIKEIMENVYKFSVPIKVNVSEGKNWKEVS